MKGSLAARHGRGCGWTGVSRCLSARRGHTLTTKTRTTTRRPSRAPHTTTLLNAWYSTHRGCSSRILVNAERITARYDHHDNLLLKRYPRKQASNLGCSRGFHASSFSFNDNDNNEQVVSGVSNSVDAQGSSDQLRLPLVCSSRSLGLLASFVQTQVEALQALPELETVLSSWRASSNSSNHGALTPPNLNESSLKSSHLTLLERSGEIMGQYQAHSPPHLAVLALRAEYHQQRGEYQAAITLLDRIWQALEDESSSSQSSPDDSHSLSYYRQRLDVQLARAKVFWFQGEWESVLQVCDSILNPNSTGSSSLTQLQLPAHPQELEQYFPLHYASARNGQSLARLVSASTLDDAFTLRDPPRMVLRFLEQEMSYSGSGGMLVSRTKSGNPRIPPVALALAQLNYGCAHVIWSDLVATLNQVHAPMNEAMRAWGHGVGFLQQIKKQEQQHHRKSNAEEPFSVSTLSLTVEACLYINLAWGTLRMAADRKHHELSSLGDDDDEEEKAALEKDVNEAMELAGKALDACDSLQGSMDVGGPVVARVLSLLASCFHLAGKAVTAEGLLQSAMEQTKPDTAGGVSYKNPQQVVDRYMVLETYRQLLQDWERRESEATQKQEQAQALLHSTLSTSWQPMAHLLAHASSNNNNNDDKKEEDTTPTTTPSLIVLSSLWFWTPSLFEEYNNTIVPPKEEANNTRS